MNKRIMKKKLNAWERKNDDVEVTIVDWVLDVLAYKNIPDTLENYIKIAKSLNIKRAAKSYAKKYLWKSGACDNVKQMYRKMLNDRNTDMTFRNNLQKFLSEQNEYYKNE